MSSIDLFDTPKIRYTISMTHKYSPQAIEKKWQAQWEKNQTFRAFNPGEKGFDPSKKPYYVLDMFPYPSGTGLHVGHASGYIGTDIIARKKRMEGFNVLHPMGWDAFGLPAEQYAIQTNQQPRKVTDTNTANFRKQLKLLGLSYDWSREIDTSRPEYYKWTQWVFLQLYKKGLVYQKEMNVWWCEELKTVLANEEVINGRSERGNFPCERRPLLQWVFKITEYAERLIEDLPELDWPDSVKKMQEEWIGKSLGAEIVFNLESGRGAVTVFSTRPDTLFGVTGLVLAPEHPMVLQVTTEAQSTGIEAYRKKAASKSDRERKAEAADFSAENTGGFALHPLTGEKIPIWIADYVLADYGTGAVMAVPCHDERDDLVSKQFGLGRKLVIQSEDPKQNLDSCFTNDGKLVNSGAFSGLRSAEARAQITAELEKKSLGKKRITYKLRDWIFSRQRYWGEPFPLYLGEGGKVMLADESELPITLPEMHDFKPSADGSSPLARLPEWVNVKYPKTGENVKRVTDTMPGWAGSCWYYLRFMDAHNTQAAWSKEAVQYWNQVDLYVGGASHAVMHLLYARFWHKVLFDCGLVPTNEPFKKLYNQGMVTAFAFRDSTGRLVPSDEAESAGGFYKRKSNGENLEKFVTKMAKSLRNVVNPDDVINERGCDTLRLYEMFMGPLDAEKPWDTEGIIGSEKFLRRTWNYFVDENTGLRESFKSENKTGSKIDRQLHRCLKRVNDSFTIFNFNTSVAGLMEALNHIQDSGEAMTKSQGEMFVKMLFPFAPHIACELWEILGNKTALDYAAWPVLNPEMLVETEFELVLQVNGKIRSKVMAQMNIPQAQALVLAKQNLAEHLAGKTVVKEIVVPNKLVNIVVK